MGSAGQRSPIVTLLLDPAASTTLAVDAEFLARYRTQIDWLLDRLRKSTAGVRGLIAATPDVVETDPDHLDAIPQLHPAIVALFAQAYANYYRSLPEEQRAAFVGFDGRFFSRCFAELFVRVFAGNGLRVLRDRRGEPTPTPVTSFMSPALGLGGGIMITASHNPPVFNGIKSSTWYGGVDTDAISERIAAEVRALTAGNGVIRLGPLPPSERDTVDAKGIYARTYLGATFDAATLAPLREALARGAAFLFDGLFGVGSMAMRRYLDTLLPDGCWQRGIHLLNETVDPRIGGIAKPDPSDPNTLVLSGAIDFLVRHPNTLLSVTADMDADRIGTAVVIPAERVARARRLGLFVSEFPTERGSVWAVRFTANQIFTLIAYDRLLAAGERFLGTRDPEALRTRLLRGELGARRFHLITTIATSVIAEQLARRYGIEFHLTGVGFKNLGWLAYALDRAAGAGRGRELANVILALMEESGGAQVGPFVAWSDRGDSIHRDKDTCSLALALFCAAAREFLAGRSLLDLYETMASQFGGLAYFERIDAYLPSQPVAEDPHRMAEADAAKQRVLRRLADLRDPANEEQLLALFGYDRDAVEPLPPASAAHVTLLAAASDRLEPQASHPPVTAYRLPDGGRLEWFAGGPKLEDGMRIDLRDARGEIRHWCLVRASGTEALLRIYLEIVEPVDAPRPERLIEVFAPLLRYLHLDEYGRQPGGPSYLDEFAANVRAKYPTA